MDNKKIIILTIIILIIIGIILIMTTNSVKYERIEITPNGTSLEVPANQTKYNGDFYGVKIWNWDNGALITYNSHEDTDNNSLTKMGFNIINNIIKNKEKQDIDGFPGYVINTDELMELHINDFIKINLNGKIFCIPLSNETSKDNIFILCNDKDMAVHIAKSVNYKNVYRDNSDNISTLNNITSDLESNLSDVI